MTDIILALQGKPCFISLHGACPDWVNDVENALGLMFTNEYREYVLCFGVASYYGHELTGICSDPALNVLKVTLSERDFYGPKIPNDWYVIERADIDGIVIWQDSITGKIYQTQPNNSPEVIASSMLGYINGEKT